MKTKYLLMFLLIFSIELLSQSPRGNQFGFGIILGEPTGVTVKYWFNNENALVGNFGTSYFGRPRLDVEYLWHFDAFNSSIVKMYAAPGGVLGFGKGNDYWYEWRNDRFYYRTGNDIGLGIKGLVGINIIPRRTPIEVFLEVGALVGIAPDFGSQGEAALGIRFYP